MVTTFQCEACKAKLKLDESKAGQTGRCPKCGYTIRVPGTPPHGTATEATSPPEQPYIPTVKVIMPRRASSLGIASMVLGIVAFVVCWIPLFGIVSIPLSALGLLLGVVGLIVALRREGSGVGYPIAGGAIAGIALLIGASQAVFFSSTGRAAAEVADAVVDAREQENATNEVTEASKPAGRDRKKTGRRQPRPKPAQPEWVPASSPLRQGDVQVRVVSVTVGSAQLINTWDGTAASSEGALLTIGLDIKNIGRTRKVEYSSWLGADFTLKRDFATLTDNFDNHYKRVDFGLSAKPVGHSASASIYPGKNIEDVLIFQEPLSTTQYLNLELPAENFGGTGMLRFRISADMIEWEE